MTYTTEGEAVFFTEYRDADYESFVTCFNKFHQGRYAYAEYLEKDFLHEKTASGDLLLTVGKLVDGTVVSVSAAERKDDEFAGIAELFMRCVSPAYQGRHVGTAHEQYLLERIPVHFPDALSLQADAVTYDIKSQTTLVHNGFYCCGLCPMKYESAQTLPALSAAPGTRMTFAIYCKPQCDSVVTVFPPPEHTAMILKIYARMKLRAKLCNYTQMPPTATVYRIVRYAEHRTADLYIKTPGNDGAPELFAELDELLANGYTVTGYINLSHPGCVGMYRRLQETGFYFTGVRPLSKIGQYLVAAQTQNSLCGFETVFLPESEQPLLDYIIENGGSK